MKSMGKTGQVKKLVVGGRIAHAVWREQGAAERELVAAMRAYLRSVGHGTSVAAHDRLERAKSRLRSADRALAQAVRERAAWCRKNGQPTDREARAAHRARVKKNGHGFDVELFEVELQAGLLKVAEEQDSRQMELLPHEPLPQDGCPAEL